MEKKEYTNMKIRFISAILLGLHFKLSTQSHSTAKFCPVLATKSSVLASGIGAIHKYSKPFTIFETNLKFKSINKLSWL